MTDNANLPPDEPSPPSAAESTGGPPEQSVAGPPPATSTSYFVSMMGAEQGPLSFSDLQMMVGTGQLTATTSVRTGTGPWFAAQDVPGLFSDRQWVLALVLSIILGELGVDRMYVGQVGLGILKLVTCGGLGIWWVIDVVLFALNRIPDSQGRPLRK
jgi:TM2 domain/GYF domain 2